MKSSSPFSTRFLWALILAGGAATIILNHGAIANLRIANQTLAAESQEAKQFRREDHEIARLRPLGEEAEKLHEANRELPKVRNEVRALRERSAELKMLRAENERLRTAKKNPGNAASPALTLPDFLPKSAVRDVGLGSPEATMQTVFWAMCQGDLDRWSQCFVDGAGRLQEDKNWQRKHLIEQMKFFVGFRVTQKKIISPNEVELGLQASIGGTVFLMELKLIEKEWKLESDFF